MIVNESPVATEPKPAEIRLCSKREAAAILKISERSVERLMQVGQIAPVRLGPRAVRVDMDALRVFVTNGGWQPETEASHE